MTQWKVNADKGTQTQVLVMGGLGFIGSHLIRLLCKQGYRVRVFDKLYATRHLIADIENKIEIVEGDAEKTEDILRAMHNMDVVIDLIHSTVPGASMTDSAYDVQSNVVSHVGWLSNLDKTAVKKIIYISSGGTVYGIPQENPICENHPTNPISSYGITKLTIEKYVTMYAGNQGIDYRICRPSNVYGEGQHLHVGQGVIGVFLDRALKATPIDIWGDGTVLRDYLYVEDMVQAIAGLIMYDGDKRVFNISSGRGHSLNEILDIMRRVLNLNPEVRYLPARRFDVPVNVLDHACVTRETGWSPHTDLATGMRYVFEYLQGRG